MTDYLRLDWLAMVLTFSAIYLLGSKSRYGFFIMMAGNRGGSMHSKSVNADGQGRFVAEPRRPLVASYVRR